VKTFLKENKMVEASSLLSLFTFELSTKTKRKYEEEKIGHSAGKSRSP